MRSSISSAFATFLFLLAALVPSLPAQDPAGKAEMYYKHRLVEDAKRTAIDTLFASKDQATLLRCKTLLGRIAADEHRFDDAVELWQDIAEHHKDTPEAKTAGLLLEQWATLARDGERTATANPLAAAYLSAAEFWMRGIPKNPDLDTAWLRTEEAAEFWLRKIVTEFPGTPAAEHALAAIARTWLGYGGDDHTRACGAWGLACTPGDKRAKGFQQDVETKMAKAEQAVRELKAAFPASPEVPRLQFLIAHVYWLHRDHARAQPWLLMCVESKSADTFWTHLARLRLQNWRS